jgi:hypothetical protein
VRYDEVYLRGQARWVPEGEERVEALVREDIIGLHTAAHVGLEVVVREELSVALFPHLLQDSQGVSRVVSCRGLCL